MSEVRLGVLEQTRECLRQCAPHHAAFTFRERMLVVALTDAMLEIEALLSRAGSPPVVEVPELAARADHLRQDPSYEAGFAAGRSAVITRDQQPRTKEAARMSDTNERSVASAGSVAGKPAAFRVDVEGIGSIMPICRDWVEVQGILNRFGDRVFGVAPLYEEQPTLTDAEREAVAWSAQAVADPTPTAWYAPQIAATLRGLLERLK